MGRRDSRYQRTSSEVRARRYLYQMRPYTEERCEGQLSCTILDWRWGGRPPHRPYGKKRPVGFTVLARQSSPQWILEGDIKGCFDAISHSWLLTHIPVDKTMLKKWLKAGYLEEKVLHATEEGTPQGGSITP